MTKRELTITGLALMIAAGLWYKLEGCVTSQQDMITKHQESMEKVLNDHRETINEYRRIIFQEYNPGS